MTTTTTQADLTFHYMAHTVLDVLEEKGILSDLWGGGACGCGSGGAGGGVVVVVVGGSSRSSGTTHRPAARSTEMYLSLLYALEDMAVYGYQTNSKVKFLLVLGVSDSMAKDLEIRSVCGGGLGWCGVGWCGVGIGRCGGGYPHD